MSGAASSAAGTPLASTTIWAPPPVRSRTERVDVAPLALGDVDGVAQLLGPRAPLGTRLADEHVEPHRRRHLSAVQAPIGPKPSTTTRLARARVHALERVQADGQRLQQRADTVGHLVGQRHRAVGGEAHAAARTPRRRQRPIEPL